MAEVVTSGGDVDRVFRFKHQGQIYVGGQYGVKPGTEIKLPKPDRWYKMTQLESEFEEHVLKVKQKDYWKTDTKVPAEVLDCNK